MLSENTRKQFNEIRKTMQGENEKFNKEQTKKIQRNSELKNTLIV